MSAPQDAPPSPPIDDEEFIDLEPTVAFGQGPLAEEPPWPDEPRRAGPVEIAAGTVGNLTAETDVLRQGRLLSVALMLAVIYGVLAAWSVLTQDREFWVLLVSWGSRVTLAVVVAALLTARRDLTPGQVRAVEYGLFGGLTAILIATQYAINLDLIRQGDTLAVVTGQKNGVIQLFALMILYGTFVPNPWRHTARVVLTMLLAYMAGLVLLLEHPEVVEFVHHLRSGEQAGSNFLVLAIGAGMAIYGSAVLNSLRAELHEAKRFGRYQLVRKLGAGGMGEVYLAEHQLLKRPCALKLIRPESGANPLALARFEREVRSAARLSHPNTIEIFDYGHADDGTFYYVMEYLRGMDLAELVHVAGPLPPGRVVYIFRQACAGLAEAHGLGLVHRDLKPANLYVACRGGEADVAKVLDFGLVKLTQDADAAELTADRTISGTPLYMPPEQATGTRDLDARADIYALGAMAYFALTGRPPFTGESPFEVMMAHARDPVMPPSELRPEVPEDLERVVLRCLEKKPEDRFPGVKELGRALAACSAADDWDADRAAAWWEEFQGVPAPPAGVAEG